MQLALGIALLVFFALMVGISLFSLGVYIVTDRLAKAFDLGRSSPSNVDSVP